MTGAVLVWAAWLGVFAVLLRLLLSSWALVALELEFAAGWCSDFFGGHCWP